jgi:hypothetical protein
VRFRLQASSLQKAVHIGVEFRVVVEDGITIRTNLGKRFTQLLHHPISGRMTSDVKMQNPAPAMLDYQEAVQELERQCGHGKEVEGNDHLTMVSEKASQCLAASLRRRKRCRYRATVRSETSTPSFRSSPWIFGAPQSAFSVAMRRM